MKIIVLWISLLVVSLALRSDMNGLMPEDDAIFEIKQLDQPLHFISNDALTTVLESESEDRIRDCSFGKANFHPLHLNNK